MSEFAYLDGKRVDAALPLRAIFYGEGLFETFRYRSRLPVFYERHYERMRQGAEYLGIPMPETGYIQDLVHDAVSASGIKDASVKVCLLSQGNTAYYELPSGGSVLIGVKDYLVPEGPFSICISRFTRNSGSPLPRIKSLNYLENVIARREALASGYDEAVFVDEAGRLAECASSNIFWVRDGVLHTPSVECGLLPGITRQILLDSAAELGLEAAVGGYSPDDLYRSGLVFLTNSIIGSGMISQVGDKMINSDISLYGRIKGLLRRELSWD